MYPTVPEWLEMKPFGPTAGRLQNRGLQVRVLPPLLAETGVIPYIERGCACFCWWLHFRCRPLISAALGAIGANKGANSSTETTAPEPCRLLEATQAQAIRVLPGVLAAGVR